MIYLDHHAATPLAPAARAAMERALGEGWANPSSVHAAGRRARAGLEDARRAVAAAIGAEPADLIFTSGGTEACNVGIAGLVRRGGGRVVTTRIEHPGVLASIGKLEATGAEVIRLEVVEGVPPAAEVLAGVLAGPTQLVATQWINHETGNVLPISEYARVCDAAGVPLFVDATQALGKVPIEVESFAGGVCRGLVALALAASKVGGPPGSGALWLRRGVDLDPLIAGGAQERGRRAGTPDAIAHAGFGAACTEVPVRLAAMPAVAALRDRLEAAVRAAGGRINGEAGRRVATACNASFPGLRGDHLVAALDLEGVCASSGAACSSGLAAPSPVIAAMYPAEPWRAASALRFSLAPSTTEAEVGTAIAALGRVLDRQRRDVK